MGWIHSTESTISRQALPARFAVRKPLECSGWTVLSSISGTTGERLWPTSMLAAFSVTISGPAIGTNKLSEPVACETLNQRTPNAEMAMSASVGARHISI